MRLMTTTVFTAGLALALAAAPALAQQTTDVHPGKGGSPHVKTTWTIDGANIAITYGRPYLKGRPAAQLMPASKVWRTGADEATTLETDRPLRFGDLVVPAGTYTLYTVPGDTSWTLIVNRQTGQWGTIYSQEQDLGRTSMTVGKTTESAEQLTFAIDDTAEGGTLRIEWGPVRATAPFTVGSGAR